MTQRSEAWVYTIGLFLAVVLTATSFWVANTRVLWDPGVPLGLVTLAIAQMGVHLVFFLHVTTGPEGKNNVLALAFGVLVVFLVLALDHGEPQREHDAGARAHGHAHAALRQARRRCRAVSAAQGIRGGGRRFPRAWSMLPSAVPEPFRK
jgi:cytochrome o ubiquinol oxidase subunit IV